MATAASRPKKSPITSRSRSPAEACPGLTGEIVASTAPRFDARDSRRRLSCRPRLVSEDGPQPRRRCFPTRVPRSARAVRPSRPRRRRLDRRGRGQGGCGTEGQARRSRIMIVHRRGRSHWFRRVRQSLGDFRECVANLFLGGLQRLDLATEGRRGRTRGGRALSTATVSSLSRDWIIRTILSSAIRRLSSRSRSLTSRKGCARRRRSCGSEPANRLDELDQVFLDSRLERNRSRRHVARL